MCDLLTGKSGSIPRKANINSRLYSATTNEMLFTLLEYQRITWRFGSNTRPFLKNPNSFPLNREFADNSNNWPDGVPASPPERKAYFSPVRAASQNSATKRMRQKPANSAYIRRCLRNHRKLGKKWWRILPNHSNFSKAIQHIVIVK